MTLFGNSRDRIWLAVKILDNQVLAHKYFSSHAGFIFGKIPRSVCRSGWLSRQKTSQLWGFHLEKIDLCTKA
jgi:hypothetical protein